MYIQIPLRQCLKTEMRNNYKCILMECAETCYISLLKDSNLGFENLSTCILHKFKVLLFKLNIFINYCIMNIDYIVTDLL